MADPAVPQTLFDRLAALEREVRALRSPQPSGSSVYTANVYQFGLTVRGTSQAEYVRIGNWVWVSASVGVTTAGVAGAPIFMSLPFIPLANVPAGMFRFYDASADTGYVAAAFAYDGGGIGLAYGLAPGLGGLYSLGQTGTPNNPPFVGAVASSDGVNVALAYMAQP